MRAQFLDNHVAEHRAVFLGQAIREHGQLHVYPRFEHAAFLAGFVLVEHRQLVRREHRGQLRAKFLALRLHVLAHCFGIALLVHGVKPLADLLGDGVCQDLPHFRLVLRREIQFLEQLPVHRRHAHLGRHAGHVLALFTRKHRRKRVFSRVLPFLRLLQRLDHRCQRVGVRRGAGSRRHGRIPGLRRLELRHPRLEVPGFLRGGIHPPAHGFEVLFQRVDGSIGPLKAGTQIVGHHPLPHAPDQDPRPRQQQYRRNDPSH